MLVVVAGVRLIGWVVPGSQTTACHVPAHWDDVRTQEPLVHVSQAAEAGYTYNIILGEFLKLDFNFWKADTVIPTETFSL